LYYLKNYNTFDVLGSLFGFSGGHAHDHVSKLLSVLQKALFILDVLPDNTIININDFSQLVENNDKIIIDATECRCARPSDPAEQKAYYSGKKKQHTVKSLVISDTFKYIFFISLFVPGSQHDYALMKKNFDPSKTWFKNIKVYLDLGFFGASKDYSGNINLPHKKQRKSKKNPNPELTVQQKKENKSLAEIRIAVEHAIGGMKVFHCLAYRIRNHLDTFINYFFRICAGLHNLKLLY
jgi:hypothetical protein